MGIRHGNWVDDTIWEFGRPAFWFLHLIGASILFFMGLRFAMRKASVPIVMYRVLRSMLKQ